MANPKGLPFVKFGDVGTLDRGISQHRPRNAPELLGGHRIQAIETLKATHRAALTELDALFASLQQRAFAGEL